MTSRSGVYRPAELGVAASRRSARRRAATCRAPGSTTTTGTSTRSAPSSSGPPAPRRRGVPAAHRGAAGDGRLRRRRWSSARAGFDPRRVHFRMRARDMARFGLLYLREGRWGDRQVVPATGSGRAPGPTRTPVRAADTATCGGCPQEARISRRPPSKARCSQLRAGEATTFWSCRT